MMMQIAPTRGCGVGRMGILLIRFMLGSLFLLSAGMGVSACAGSHYPRPESWPEPAQGVEAPCDRVAGVYSDRGSSGCEWYPPGFRSLSCILEPCLFYDLVPTRHLEKADRVEIMQSGPGRIAVAVYDAQGNLLAPDAGGDLQGTYTEGGILLSYKPRMDPRENIEVVSGTLLLSRGADGSLICRVIERRLFCSFIIPAPFLSRSYTVWYRFESREKTIPAGQANPGASHLKDGSPPEGEH